MQGRRGGMEDITRQVFEFVDPSWTLLLVADGHGGATTASLVCEHLPASLAKHLTPASTPEQVCAAMVSSFAEVDAALRPQLTAAYDHSGACVVCTLMTPTHFITAFCGDCVSFVLRILDDGTRVIVPLSHDHSPTDPKETERIAAADLPVYNGRINGDINVSRAFGDFMYKNDALAHLTYAVTSHPDTVITPRTPADAMLLLGSDGIVDLGTSHTDKDRVPLRLLDAMQSDGHSDPMHLAVLACDHAYASLSADNLCATVWVSDTAASRFGSSKEAMWPAYMRKRAARLRTQCACMDVPCTCERTKLNDELPCRCPKDGSLCGTCDTTSDPFPERHEEL